MEASLKACCTYCSIETDGSPGLVAAAQRWGSNRVKNAVRFAAEHKMPLYLLAAQRGLVAPETRVPPGGAGLGDEEIDHISRLVQRQLEEKGIDLHFLVTPSHRLALAYVRALVVACDRAAVTLELLDHRGEPFPDWSKAYRQAQEARNRARKGANPIEKTFADLFRRYGKEDGMIWLERGRAFMDRNQPARALADFENAAQLLVMKEWRESANAAAKQAARALPKVASLPASRQVELEEIEQLAREPALKRLGREAFLVADLSPSASILLCYAALDYVAQRWDRLPPDLKDRIGTLRRTRNEVAHGFNGVAHGWRIAEPGEAVSARAVLLDVLRFIHKREWTR